MTELLEFVANLGISEEQDDLEARRIRILNLTILTALTLNTSWTLVFIIVASHL